MGRGSLLVLTACATFVACDRPEEASTPSLATEQTIAAPLKLNIDEIFPPGEGRDLVLNNCTSCHTIVPIVVLRMTKEAWELNAREHRDRVTSLSDAEVATLYAYLVANFNPNRPVPTLPRELLDTWTAY